MNENGLNIGSKSLKTEVMSKKQKCNNFIKIKGFQKVFYIDEVFTRIEDQNIWKFESYKWKKIIKLWLHQMSIVSWLNINALIQSKKNKKCEKLWIEKNT